MKQRKFVEIDGLNITTRKLCMSNDNYNTISENSKSSDPKSQIYDTALQLLKMGYSVIPLQPREKHPVLVERVIPIRFLKNGPRKNEIVFPNKNGTPCIKRTNKKNWSQWQTKPMSVSTAKKYFSQDINIGFVTGFNNVVVLDFDNNDLFYQWYSEHMNIVQNTPFVQTGSGKYHVYVRLDTPFAKSPKFYIDGELAGDFQSVGSQVVLPPSIHPNGNEYQWINSIFDFEPVTVPIDELGIELFSTQKPKVDYNKGTSLSSLSKDKNSNQKLSFEPVIIKWSKERYFEQTIINAYDEILNAPYLTRMKTFNREYLPIARITKGLGYTFDDLQPLIEAAKLSGLEQKEIDDAVKSIHNLAIESPQPVIFQKEPVEKVLEDADNYPDSIFIYDPDEQQRVTLSRKRVYFDMRNYINSSPEGKGILQDDFRKGYYSTAGSQEAMAKRCDMSKTSWKKYYFQLREMGYVDFHKDMDNRWCYRLGEIYTEQDGVRWYLDEPKFETEEPEKVLKFISRQPEPELF